MRSSSYSSRHWAPQASTQHLLGAMRAAALQQVRVSRSRQYRLVPRFVCGFGMRTPPWDYAPLLPAGVDGLRSRAGVPIRRGVGPFGATVAQRQRRDRRLYSSAEWLQNPGATNCPLMGSYSDPSCTAHYPGYLHARR